MCRKKYATHLEALTERPSEHSPADAGAAEPKKRLVDVGAPLPANAQAAEAVQPREGALDHPAVDAQPASVRGAALGDEGLDPAGSQLASVRLGVVAAVGVEGQRSPSRSAGHSSHRGHGVNELDELRDVVAVRRRQAEGQRGAVAVDEQVVLAARSRAVRWIGTRLFPPLLQL